jgi:hypothetical protein
MYIILKLAIKTFKRETKGLFVFFSKFFATAFDNGFGYAANENVNRSSWRDDEETMPNEIYLKLPS